VLFRRRNVQPQPRGIGATKQNHRLHAHNGTQNDDRQRVLDATDIVRLVADHITLKPKGREYVGLCPFHNDRNPSMGVAPHKQIFHCFVCGTGGGAIDFVMKFHGMSYGEALRYLADRAGIELTPWKPTRRAADPGSDEHHEDAPGVPREALVFANAFAVDFFRTILRHPEHGSVARAVVEQRRIAPEMVEKFQVGAAPDRWDGLLKTIESKGHDPEPFIAAGLLKRREHSGGGGGGGLYDALRNRLIFPILDQIGRPIAFGGRKINPEDEPKYLNSPETDLFKKSSTLFAMPQAFRAIQQQRCAVITEGYTDAIACHQAGFENVVATLGTALTPKHAGVLRRVCDKVVLLFDSDEAGQIAADRALDVFFTETIDVQVMALPGGKDPDEVLKTEGGADLFRAQLASAVDVLDYRFARKAAELRDSGARAGSAAHTRMIEEDLSRLAELGLDEVSPLRRSAIVNRYAAIAGVPNKVILDTLDRRRGRAPARRAPEGGAEVQADGSPVEASFTPRSAGEEALACAMAHSSLGDSRRAGLIDAITAILAAAPRGPIAALAQRALDTVESGGSVALKGLVQNLEDAEARQLAIGFAQTIERRTGGDDSAIAQAFDDAVRQLEVLRTQRSVNTLLNEHRSTPPQAAASDETVRLQQLIELRRQAAVGPLLTIPRPSSAARTG